MKLEQQFVKSIRDGDREKVRQMLTAHPNLLNTQHQGRDSPVMIAVNNAHLDIAEILLRAGADPYQFTDSTGIHGINDTIFNLLIRRKLTHLVDVVLELNLIVNPVGPSYSPLFAAVEEADFPMVEKLIDHCTSLDVWRMPGSSYYESPLFVAVRKRNMPLASLLHSLGADVNYTCPHGLAPLHTLVAFFRIDEEYFEIMKELHRLGAVIDSHDRYGETLLHKAVRLAQPLYLAEWLLGNDVPIDAQDVCGYTPLHKAAFRGNIPAAELLLSHGADIKARDRFGRTPLHRAAAMGRLEMAELLLARGAELNAADRFGNTPLNETVYFNRLASSDWFKERGAIGFDEEDGGTDGGGTPGGGDEEDPIQVIEETADIVEMTQTLDSSLKKIDCRDIEAVFRQDHRLVDYYEAEYGVTWLHLAARNGHGWTLNMLLVFGANVHPLSNSCMTPLHLSIADRSIFTSLLLIQSGADMAVRSEQGVIPLDYAYIYFSKRDHEALRTAAEQHGDIFAVANMGSVKGIRERLDENLELAQAVDPYGRTALHHAARCGFAEAVRELLKSGADVNAQDCVGNTPLHLCLMEKRHRLAGNITFHAVAEALLDGGADVSIASDKGRTPLDMFRTEVLVQTGPYKKPPPPVSLKKKFSRSRLKTFLPKMFR